MAGCVRHRRRARDTGRGGWRTELQQWGDAAGGRAQEGVDRQSVALALACTSGGGAARALTSDLLKMQGRATPAAGDGRQRGWTAAAKGEKEMLELGGIL